MRTSLLSAYIRYCWVPTPVPHAGALATPVYSLTLSTPGAFGLGARLGGCLVFCLMLFERGPASEVAGHVSRNKQPLST